MANGSPSWVETSNPKLLSSMKSWSLFWSVRSKVVGMYMVRHLQWFWEVVGDRFYHGRGSQNIFRLYPLRFTVVPLMSGRDAQ